MFKRHAPKAIFYGLIVALFLVSLGSTPSTQAAATRIMPLGDSITGSPGCWRALLWNRLQNTGFTNIDFVGTLPPQGCGVPYDGDNEGHGGILVTNIANQNQLPPWLSATSPDIIVMHLGTNDVWNGIATTTILNAYSTLVDQMRASNPNMKIVVAQILPMNPSNCSACGQRVIDLNNAIPGWASGKSTAQSPILVVDQWTGFSTSADTSDGVHPNDTGIQKMSDKWYPALTSLLTAGPTNTPTRTSTSMGPTSSATRTPTRTPTSIGPTRTPTRTSTPIGPTRTPTRTPTPGGGSGCAVTYAIPNDWGAGFTANLTIRNNGAAATNGWTLAWSFPGNQQITNLWNGSYTQSGQAVSVTNLGYNATIAANGGTVEFGFNANYSGTNARPAAFTLNGTACSVS